MAALSDSISFDNGPDWANRFALAPLTNLQSHADGTLSDDEFAWLVRRAEGGFGLTMSCAAHVLQQGQGFPGQLGVFSDDHLPGLTRLADAIRKAGSVSSVQLHHAGERAPADLAGDPVAPFAVPEAGVREMTTDEVKAAIDAYVAAAVRCEKAGFDGIELHGAHGYLLCSFLDDRNVRGDGYGGDWADRTRAIREAVDGVRAATRPGFQVGLRLSPERFGYSTASALALAGDIMTGGRIDYLDMSLWDCFKTPRDLSLAEKPLIDWFTALPRGTCKLGVAGKIQTAATAQACLDHGADFVLIGRAAILHHDFPRRACADPAFEWKGWPVSRSYLESESVGPAFRDYLATQWKDYVTD